MLLMLMEYKFEGIEYNFIYNLLDLDQMDKMQRTLVWAANKGVVVTLRSTKHSQAAKAA